MAVLSQ